MGSGTRRLLLALALLLCVVAAGCAGVTAGPNTAPGTGLPPSITTQPSSQSVTAGKTATFTVAAVGTAPLAYQWRKNSAAISGATSTSYTTPATTSSDSGAVFDVVVSNSAASVTSTAATLTVSAAPVPPSITGQPTSQTVTAGQTATFSVAAGGTAPLNYQWQRNGAAINGATAVIYTTPATTTSDSGSTFNVLVTNSVGSVTSGSATLTVNAAAAAPSITTQPASQTVTAGQTATFSVAASGTAPLNYQWQRNGAAINGATAASYTTPATTTSDSGSTFNVLVTNSVGSVTSGSATLTVNAAAVAPSITTQPASQTVTAGQTATFSVAATGTAPLNYQWQKNGVNIGGSSASYTTPATTSADNGSTFVVIVSNSKGSMTSTPATLTVNPATVAPSITTQPANQTVTAGQTATFSVVASGTAPLSYQWQKNGAPIGGATSASYTTPATATSDSGSTFKVVVTNSAGSAASNPASLTVNAAVVAPSVTTQPLSQTVTAGQTATFSVAASGTAPLSYQWQKNGAAIGGAAGSSYVTPTTTTSDSGSSFAVVVSNSKGSVTSATATLTVNAAAVLPNITTQPANQTVTAGQTATFSVVATGTAPLNYQWQKNGAAISGGTAASYTTPVTAASDNGAVFDVVVSNSAGSATSSSATLTVTTGSSIGTVTISLNPGLAISPNFGGISTFDIEDDGDLMGNSSKGYNPIYRQLIKNLIFPGQQFVITSEDDTGAAGGVTTAPTPTQVTALGQLHTDLTAAGYTVGIMPGVAGLCTGNEALAKAYGQAWISNMPSGSILGMVMGNEPDGPCGLAYSTYFSRFQQYTADIQSMSGGAGMKFMGPQFGGQLPWNDTGADMIPFIDAEHAILYAAGQHWYALNGCSGSPTLSGLLSRSAATNASSILSPYVSAAHSNGTTLRISEMNSIDCGGRSGISDTMASALWVMDGMFNLASVGVDGVNIFSDEGDNYDLFGFTSTSAPYHISFIRPEYYGFMVFQEATQNGAKLLPLTISTSSSISAWATVDNSLTVRVLIINKDQSATGNIQIALPGYGGATVKMLLAPSVSSTTGVKYAGQTFDGSPDGTIQGALAIQSISAGGGVYTIDMPVTSAALLTIAP